MNKPALRQHYTAILTALSTTAKTAAAAKVAAHLRAQNFATDKIIAGYWPLPTEIDGRDFLQATPNQVALPIVVGHHLPLEFGRWLANQALGKDIAGVPAPLGAPRVLPDILLVPGLAFTATGKRLGRGGGFYDRTLKQLRQTKPIMAIGVGFACQIASDLPLEDHDEILDFIITDAGVINPSRP